MLIHRLQQTTSTSSYLRSELPDAPHGTVVTTHTQTAGRGQRGNSWEAEPGRNLTFSVMLRPDGADARSQYAVSEAVATAIASTLRPLVDRPELLTVKWPNDIYYGDRKLCGILIENTLTGLRIDRSIAGIGINVNQTEFLSDAPNPVSLKQLTGREYDLDRLLEDTVRAILEAVDALRQGHAETHRRYLSMLWRREGLHPYSTPAGEVFMAEIADVAPTGLLTLRHADGTLSTHAFKEVTAILS